MDPINTKIWEKFHIKKHDTLPFTPWLPDANRHTISELFAELGYKKGAEIGVRMGEHAKDMFDCNPGLELLLIDTWAPYARVVQERQDRYFRRCKRTVAPYKATIMKMSSMEAVKEVPDESLDFVYIDGRHEFSFVIQDLIEWSPKVKQGGVVSGHDYYNFYAGGVILAVDVYTRAYNINQWYVTKEKEPSYFWGKTYRDVK
jgi:hypothetical protein